MKNDWERDKAYLLGWMEKNCCGFANARVKDHIMPYLLGKWNERHFREIMSDLKKENHISSTSSLGYWFNPLQTKDPDEIKAEMQSAQEMKSRAMSIIEGADKRIRSCAERLSSLTFQPNLL